MRSWRLPLGVFWACPSQRKPWGRHKDYILHLIWPGNASRRNWKGLLGRRTCGILWLACYHHDWTPDEGKKMDDGLKYVVDLSNYCTVENFSDFLFFCDVMSTVIPVENNLILASPLVIYWWYEWIVYLVHFSSFSVDLSVELILLHNRYRDAWY